MYGEGSVWFPERAAELAASLSASISLDRLIIDEVSLDLSLRSSTGLYIALDHSPLKLNLFDRYLNDLVRRVFL